MKVSEVGLLDECFTHIAEDGKQTSYAVTKLVEYLAAHNWEKVVVPVEEFHAAYCVNNRGVEPDRIARLLQCVPALVRPIVFIHMPDNSHLLVDGTHRYVALFGLNRKEIFAHMVPWDVAKDFILEDIPNTTPERLMQHSHLSQLRELLGIDR